jgi:hypothetical protein
MLDTLALDPMTLALGLFAGGPLIVPLRWCPTLFPTTSRDAQ